MTLEILIATWSSIFVHSMYVDCSHPKSRETLKIVADHVRSQNMHEPKNVAMSDTLIEVFLFFVLH